MILAELNLSSPQKLTLFKALAQDDEIQADVQTWFDSMLLTSELRPIQRIAATEAALGLNGMVDYEDENREVTIPERIEALEHKAPLVTEMQNDVEVTPTIETTKDMKACAVVEYLQKAVKPNDFGEFAIGKKELTTFMQGIIEEGLRVEKVSRQLKADLFERAVKLFPQLVYIKKSPSGNKTQTLALKASVKRTFTHGMTRTTALGILA
jgi:hypothetical protein